MSVLGLLQYAMKHLVATICSIVVIGCIAAYFIRNETIVRMAADYDDLNVRRTRILKNFRYSASLEQDLEEMRKMSDESEIRLFDPEDLASNYSYFYKLETNSEVKLSNLQQMEKPLPAGKAGAKARKKAAKAKYRSIVYEMNVSGDYENVLNFLRGLEGGKSFYRLEAVAMADLKGSLGSEPRVTMRISLNMLGSKS